MDISEHLPQGNSEGQYLSDCVSYDMLIFKSYTHLKMVISSVITQSRKAQEGKHFEQIKSTCCI